MAHITQITCCHVTKAKEVSPKKGLFYLSFSFSFMFLSLLLSFQFNPSSLVFFYFLFFFNMQNPYQILSQFSHPNIFRLRHSSFFKQYIDLTLCIWIWTLCIRILYSTLACQTWSHIWCCASFLYNLLSYFHLQKKLLLNTLRVL